MFRNQGSYGILHAYHCYALILLNPIHLLKERHWQQTTHFFCYELVLIAKVYILTFYMDLTLCLSSTMNELLCCSLWSCMYLTITWSTLYKADSKYFRAALEPLLYFITSSTFKIWTVLFSRLVFHPFELGSIQLETYSYTFLQLDRTNWGSDPQRGVLQCLLSFLSPNYIFKNFKRIYEQMDMHRMISNRLYSSTFLECTLYM